MSGAGRSNRRVAALLVILGLSLVLKLIVWWAVASSDPSRFLRTDSHSYHRSAQALVETGRFAVSPDEPDKPQTGRTPGYPAFLAAVYAIFGSRPEAGIAAQILLSLATIALVWRIAAERWNERVAGLAAVLMACDPASFGLSLLLLTETFFALLVCCLLYVAWRSERAESGYRWYVLLGLLLALATLVRPVSYYLVVPLAVWVGLATGRRHRSWWRTATSGVCFVIPYLLLIGGWHGRNWHRTGTAVFSSIEGINMLYYRGAGILALRDGIDIHRARERLGEGRYQELHPETRDWTDEQLASRWKREGLELIREHPLLFARQELRGLAAIFLGTGEHTVMKLLAIPLPSGGPMGDLLRLDPSDYAERWLLGRPVSFLVFLVCLTYLGVLYAGAGAWWLPSHQNRSIWDLCCWGVLAYLAVVSAGPEAYHRFRVPLAPILCLYGAAGLPWIRRVLHRRR